MNSLYKKICVKFILISFLTLIHIHVPAQSKLLTAGAKENTPSVSIYFDWINRNWYGSNENKVLKDITFFKWMKEKYGMQLDIFLLDVGMFDNGPACVTVAGRPAYGDMNSPLFHKEYPHGMDTIYKAAMAMGTRLGVWIGPDGYGNTTEDARKRINLLVSLCRDYKIRLLKMDACCSDLRPEKEKYFIEAMQQARKYSPDLIVLNHRITLSDNARKYTTTFLWEGKETYTDVHIMNDTPGLHHREGNLKRGYPPGLQRLTEDHGVCLSSAMDYWEDDLILQAFNRNLILAPEIYGNPWLLKDEEFAVLARIYRLHKKYNSIMTEALALPEEQYGYKAIARGNKHTRLITLRNLSWNTKSYQINIDSSIGMNNAKKVYVKLLHPFEEDIGVFKSGQKVHVSVLPFRSALVLISDADDDFFINGTPYLKEENLRGNTEAIKLLGSPGTTKRITITLNKRYNLISLNGESFNKLRGKSIDVRFPGEALKLDYHRRLGTLTSSAIPSFSEAIYETMCFANDNNALEVRSLQRAGKTRFPVVQAARDAFFKDNTFITTGAFDKYAIDEDSSTAFKTQASIYTHNAIPVGALRIDAGFENSFDHLVLQKLPTDYTPETVFASNDLSTWKEMKMVKKENNLEIISPGNLTYRYAKIVPAPASVSEINGYNKEKKIDRTDWKLSNLFAGNVSATIVYKASFVIEEAAKKSYLVLTVPGTYQVESVFAGLYINGKILAPIDRSPSFLYNNWEHIDTAKGNLSFYFSVTKEMINKKAEVFLFSGVRLPPELQPELWITAPIPFVEKKLELK